MHVRTESKGRLRPVDEELPLVPDAATLRNVELLTLETDAGWLDVHRRVDGAPGYDALRRAGVRMGVGGFAVLGASLEDMLAMKHACRRPQDFVDIETLEAIRRMRGAGP